MAVHTIEGSDRQWAGPSLRDELGVAVEYADVSEAELNEVQARVQRQRRAWEPAPAAWDLLRDIAARVWRKHIRLHLYVPYLLVLGEDEARYRIEACCSEIALRFDATGCPQVFLAVQRPRTIRAMYGADATEKHLIPSSTEDMFWVNLGDVHRIEILEAPQIEWTVNGQIWLFQANPQYYPLADVLTRVATGDGDSWAAVWHRREMQPGDKVLFWQSGSERGVYALGELTGHPYERTWEVTPDEAEQQPFQETGWWAPFRYTYILRQPLFGRDLKQHPVLQNLQVLRSPTGTNFCVTAEQWLEIVKLLPSQDIASPEASTS